MTKTNIEIGPENTSTNLHNIISILKYPVISDKTTRILENNKYTFMVDRHANKLTIKKVIEYVFDVNVTNINTLMSPTKKRTVGRFSGYQARYKKAIVTLKDGDKINLFPDM
jgi:large subunit ribosomal protein L23